MRIRQSANWVQSSLSHDRTQGSGIKVNDVLGSFKRRPAPTHDFSQYTANVGRCQNNMTAGQSVIDELFDE